MKKLLEAINRGILKGLNEQNVELLSDLDDDLVDLDIQKKNINNLVDVSKQLMQQSLLSGELTPNQIKSFNNPKDFKRYNALIKVQTKNNLINLINEFVPILGNNANLNWIDTSDITDMSGLFTTYTGYKFTGDISLWDVSNVTNMDRMFHESNFNGDISNWDVSNVATMEAMFYKTKFNGDISQWNVKNVQNMKYMFFGTPFTGDISNWNVKNCKHIDFMFTGSKMDYDNRPVFY